MRTYGRPTPNAYGPSQWVEVSTDPSGYNDAVMLTTLAQCLALILGESPFYANYGLPAYRSAATGIPPDYYVAQTQAQFAPNFASLIVNSTGPNADGDPSYNINAIAQSGATLGGTIPR